ncbi:hypothetical protein [Bowmanella yangjiangensis]|uniref:Rap1a immunity protein domain-containing protein n=1 Tax=Bowmanella yangjiangensis TaxID=2811230 RepID=A0ABS3CTI6_9ALTE|nr:hypothetical protein [Bowmanella yangjiangensis]MBN7819824.1 hypothetical protein [Bowmanella yangjiangensis]
MFKPLLTTSVLTMLMFTASPSQALSMAQFVSICESASGKCREHPTVQAYVGGALDLLATLNEHTHYLSALYCKDPKTLFNVPVIIDFMQTNADRSSNQNAMLLVVRYFEAHGGCSENS